MLSRKHYIAVADILRDAAATADDDAGSAEQYGAVEGVGYGLADYFAADSPSFDRARFLKAAGPC